MLIVHLYTLAVSTAHMYPEQAAWALLDGGDGDDEKKRAAKLERAVRAEKTRQDQAKYWAKYHEKEERAKAKARAARGGAGGAGGEEAEEEEAA